MLRSAAIAALATALGVLPAAPASGQVIVDAGPHLVVRSPQVTAPLSGSLTNGTPLDFWIADGDHATENKLLKYDDLTGVTAVGPLQSPSGQSFGWPSDLERVGDKVYGIETFHRYLYVLDPASGICTPVGAQVTYTTLFGLAYDYFGDKLYAVDQKTRKLLLFNRSTGTAKVVLTLPSTHADVRSLGFRHSDRKLYYSDDATETIYRVDPGTGVNETVLALNDGPDAKVDELDFFAGRCFVSYRTYDSGMDLWDMQFLQIDVDQGEILFEGPVIGDCSAHSLLVNSIPETTRWVQLSGPSQARILHPEQLSSLVRFDAPGRYRFELRAIGAFTTTTDTVDVWVQQGGAGPGVPGSPIRLR